MVHHVYAQLPPGIRAEVDTAYEHAMAVLASAGLQCANDDRAERLVEAMAVYVLAANPALHLELVAVS